MGKLGSRRQCILALWLGCLPACSDDPLPGLGQDAAADLVWVVDQRAGTEVPLDAGADAMVATAEVLAVTSDGAAETGPVAVDVGDDGGPDAAPVDAPPGLDLGAAAGMDAPLGHDGRPGRLDAAPELFLTAFTDANVSVTPPALTLTPSGSRFPTAVVGTTGASVVFTLSNQTAVPVSGLAVSISSPEFAVSADACAGSRLATGETCTFAVTFAPIAIGQRSTTVEVSNGSVSVSAFLCGAVISDDPPSTWPDTLDFGTVAVASPAVTRKVSVMNPGRATGPLSVELATDGSFSFDRGTCDHALTMEDSCSFDVTFDPTTAGSHTGTVTVLDGETSLVVPLLGIADDRALFVVSPSFLDFGAKLTSGVVSTQVITVTAARDLVGLVATPSGPDVALDPGGTCTSTLLAGASCTVVVAFTPRTDGREHRSVAVAAGGSAGKTVTVPVTAQVTLPPQLVTHPAEATLVATAYTVSAPAVFEITNTGGLRTAIPELKISGRPDFYITSSDCMWLPPGGSCTVTVRFHPIRIEPRTGSLYATQMSVGARLIGIVPSPRLQLSPSRADLGPVAAAGGASTALFTLTNQGDIPSDRLRVSLSGDAPFAIAADTCSDNWLAEGESCTIGVELQPVVARSTTLQVTDGLVSAQALVVGNPDAPIEPARRAATAWR